MTKVTISRAVDELNRRAAAHAIGALQQIRVQIKGLRRSSSRTIFSSATTAENWAFHHGGRSELQFNIGVETLEGVELLRHGVAFSLETSRSLPSIDVLFPKIRLFNEFLKSNAEMLANFQMWYFRNGQRSSSSFPSAVTADLMEPGVFIFLGAIQPINHIDYKRILTDFDFLLPLYKFVESNGTLPPYKDSPGTFSFRAGNSRKNSTATASLAERQVSISLRHNDLQAVLYSQLCAEYGPENVGTERSSGSGGRIDAVARTTDGYIFFEIKVGQSLQGCIREAIGQLLEYSYWPGSQRATSLVVVGEPPLDDQCRAYIDGLQQKLSIPISYRQIVCDGYGQQGASADRPASTLLRQAGS